mmetsp:Transcript_45731/g.126973  ORF Transcript_45731/g.126973 Transcript_45731/m.126973 type:complete len:271 (+) Transcript_45731:204-1016(+)
MGYCTYPSRCSYEDLPAPARVCRVRAAPPPPWGAKLNACRGALHHRSHPPQHSVCVSSTSHRRPGPPRLLTRAAPWRTMAHRTRRTRRTPTPHRKRTAQHRTAPPLIRSPSAHSPHSATAPAPTSHRHARLQLRQLTLLVSHGRLDRGRRRRWHRRRRHHAAQRLGVVLGGGCAQVDRAQLAVEPLLLECLELCEHVVLIKVLPRRIDPSREHLPYLARIDHRLLHLLKRLLHLVDAAHVRRLLLHRRRRRPRRVEGEFVQIVLLDRHLL